MWCIKTSQIIHNNLYFSSVFKFSVNYVEYHNISQYASHRSVPWCILYHKVIANTQPYYLDFVAKNKCYCGSVHIRDWHWQRDKCPERLDRQVKVWFCIECERKPWLLIRLLFVSQLESHEAVRVVKIWDENREGNTAAGNNVFPIFSQQINVQ